MIISKLKSLVIVLFLSLNGWTLSFGQLFPVDVNAVLIPPHSLNLSDYGLEKSQDLMINMTLNDPVEPFWDVRFRVTVSNNGVDILQTNPSYQPTPYRLNQFSTVVMSGFEIADYFNFKNLISLNGYTYTGILPEGLNSICIEVLDYNRQDVILSGKICASGYGILNDPPYPQLPLCGSDQAFQEAQNLVFSWLPMHLGSPNPVSGVEYEFTLVKVENGYNEYEAVEASSPMYQETTSNTTIVLQDPILEPGYTYAWRVRATDSFGGNTANLFKNDGYSTVCTFNYMQDEVDFTELYESSVSTECGASCQTNIPSNSEIITDLSVGEQVQVGNFFMNVSKINSASGGFYEGKGYIFIPFLLSNMNVTFSDMTVNTDGVVFSGNIETDIDSDLITDNFKNTDGEMSVNAEEIAAINQYIEDEGRQSNQMEYGSSLGLPIAIDNTIGGVTNNLIVTGITFEPDVAYLNAVMSFESAEAGNNIAFGGKGICFHPYGIGGGTAQIFLYEDFSLGDYSDFDLTFKAPGGDNGGTYITFDCTGFLELNIEGEYEFPTNVLVAADGSGNAVVATFNITTSEWGQFIAELEMDEFEVHGVDGYTFTVDEAYLDYSDVANPDGAEFPEDYEDTGDDWKGFYLSTLSLSLPDDLSQASGDISIGTQNVVIDHSGVSANIFAAGLLDLDNGKLGEWAFSIDTVQIDIVSNSLVDGSLLGQIHVPILDEENSLNYSALMAKSDEGVDLLFTINTEEDVSVSMWAAEMSLASTSVIAFAKTDEGFIPYAELNGDLTLAMEIQEGNAFEIEALAFEGLKINHPEENKRIAVDAFSLFGGGSGSDDASSEEEGSDDEQESLSGFPVSISNVAFEEGDGDQAGINFDLNLNLTGDDLGVAGTANIIVTGAYDAAGAPFNAWKFEGVELSAIEVDADIAAGSIKGSLEIYKGDATYGSGFKGLLSAQFTGIGKVDALAQFGQVNSFRYFFVDAMVLSQSPFIDVLGIGLYGFGGGMYHHMSRDDSDPAMNLEAGTLYAEPSELGASLSGIKYVPNKKTLLGLKAALTMGIAPGTSFSTDAYFEGSFGLNNSVPSIESMAFGGKAYFMSPGSILDREDSQVIGQFDANLDLSEPDDPVFTGTAQVTFDTDVISGSGSAAMKLSKKESYVWIGTPKNPINIGVSGLGSFKMYADMGDRVPSMPNVSDLVPNYRGTTISQRPTDLGGTKIIFGAKFAMPKKSFNYGSFYASAQFGLGFDAYLRQVNAADCGIATGKIGIDSWYLSGQAYAYGSGNIGLKVKTWFYKGNVNLLNLSASMVMQAELPNPTWINGDVNVKYKVLGGAIKGNIGYEFEIGERCAFEENPISGISVIADTSPKNGETNVNCFASPAAVCNLPINEIMEIEQLDSDGDVITHQYMPYVSSHTITGGHRSYQLSIEEDGDLIVLDQQDLLDEYTYYNVSITVKWKKRKKGSSRWEVLDQEETKTFRFKTGKKPDFIPEDAVSYANPLPNRRNVYDQNLRNKWRIWLKTKGWGYLFEDKEFTYYLRATNMETGSTIKRVTGYLDHPYFHTGMVGFGTNYSVAFNSWLNNQNGAMIKGEVIGVYKGTSSNAKISTSSSSKATGVNAETKSISGTRVKATVAEDKLIYKWYFRMSDFDTPHQKIRAYSGNRETSWTYSANWTDGLKGHRVDGGLHGSEERLDHWDMNATSYKIGRYTINHPRIIGLHRVNYDASGSRAKSAMDRWWWMKSVSDYYSYRSVSRRIRYFHDNFWNKGDHWRRRSDQLFSFNKWTIWGSSSPYVSWWCNRCKSELTDAEKNSGNADQGYTKWGWTSIRFQDTSEQMIAYRYMELARLRYYMRDSNLWAWMIKSYKGGWHSSGSWDKSVWMMGVNNWDAGEGYKIIYMNHE